MYEGLFDATDEKWVMLEIHAWIETLSLFRAPIPGHKNYPDDVQRLLADAEQYLRRISLAQVFDERIVSRLRQYVEDLLSNLGGLSEAVYTAYTIKRAGKGLEDLVEDAAVFAQGPMSSAEKEELRASLLERVQSYGDKLDALKRNLDADNAKCLEEGTTSQLEGSEIKPPRKRKVRKRKRSGN